MKTEACRAHCQCVYSDKFVAIHTPTVYAARFSFTVQAWSQMDSVSSFVCYNMFPHHVGSILTLSVAHYLYMDIQYKSVAIIIMCPYNHNGVGAYLCVWCTITYVSGNSQLILHIYSLYYSYLCMKLTHLRQLQTRSFTAKGSYCTCTCLKCGLCHHV